MSESTNGHVYELRDVHRTFSVGGQEVRAVDGVDMQVSPGEFLVVEGPSGSGKSTLLQLLGALDRPTSGAVTFGGRDLSSLGDRELTKVRAQEIGFVFQTFNLIPTLTAAENVEIAMAPLETPKKQKKERAQALLDQLGLGGRSAHLPTLMSGGEQQRVAIARAMANAPRVILADEPTGNLDSTTADEIIGVLADLCASEGVTLVVVTHSEDVARRSARRLRMRDGRLLDDAAWQTSATVPSPPAPPPAPFDQGPVQPSR